MAREGPMASMAVQLTIGDYAKWRPTFEKFKHLRTAAGLRGERVYRDTNRENEVLVWGDTDDVAKVRQALAGPEMRAAMQEAGVVGPPKIHVVG
jgi:hypothetical protein